MLRGTFAKQTVIQALLLCGVALTPWTSIRAGSAARAVESNTGKAAAPTKEDGLDYFSSSRKNISPEDARQADVLRVKTINSITTLLADKKNSKNEFELTLRLGELYVERADYLRDIEIAEYIKAHDTWSETDPSKRTKNPPQANYKRSQTSLYNAVQTFRKIAAKFASHPRSDAVLYSLAKTLSRLDDDNAVQYYRQLIASHPKSKLIPDAWLALGELHFDKNRIKEATEAYQKVMDFKGHRVYPYAVYKLGWCFYNSQGVQEKTPGQNLEKSLAAFQLVVKLADTKKSSNFNLREESLRDIVMVFAELEDTQRAWTYFKSVDEVERFYSMLDRLGGMYADAGKTAKAIDVYNRLVAESPTRKNNPQIYQKLVDLYDQSNQFAQVVKTIRSMQSQFVDGSKWISANDSNKPLLEDARSITERTMHRYGTMFNRRGIKIKNKDLEALAAEIYGMYLQSFEKTEAAYDIRFYLADIQLSQKKFAQASANFIAVAKQKPKDGKHLKEAAVNAVEAMDQWTQTEKFAAVPPPGQAPTQLTIPRVKKLYADTIDFYLSTLPNEAAGIPMRYTAAQIYFDYGYYSEAIKRFDELATRYSSTKQGHAAARVIVAYYNEKTDWNNVIAFGKKFQTNKLINQDATVKKFIDDSLRGALFNSALAAEKAKDYDKASESFLDFQRLFPTDGNADRAIYNAALNQFKATKVEASLETQKHLLAQYPKSTLGPDVMANMGETYEAIAQFQDAAAMYKRLAAAYPNDHRAPLSLYNAAVLFRGVKQPQQSLQMFSELHRRFPSHKLATDALLEAAKLSEATGDMKGAISNFAILAARPDLKHTNDGYFAQAKVIDLKLSADPKNDPARRDLGKLIAAMRAKNSPAAPEARSIVARIMFNDQESAVRAFSQVRLGDPKELEHQAGVKQAKLVRLANAYQDVISIGNPEYAVASYYRLGELHEDFSKALFSVPPPANFNAKDAADFKSQLERSAFPLRDQAVKFFETAYQQSSEVESFSPWTQKTYQKMVQLAPEKHPDMQETAAEPGYLTSRIAINRATENLAH